MNSDLISNIDKFINYIKNTDIYKRYINILNQVNNSKEINELTNSIKNIEKQLVLTPSIELESKLEYYNNLLNSIPLYLDYKDIVLELNNMLVQVKNKFDLFIEDISL